MPFRVVTLSLAGALAGAVALAAVPAGAATYDLASDFGSTNPSGPWTYGFFGPGFTPGELFPDYDVGPQTQAWSDHALSQYGAFGTPNVSHNFSASEWTCCNSVVLLPGQASAHPGQNDEIAGYLFNAPTTGAYTLNATFSGRDYVGPTDTEALIIDGNMNTIFSGIVNGYAGDSSRAAFGPSPSISYSGTLNLTAGEQIYLLVEWDPNGTRPSGPFYYDTTGISGTFSTVPEPASVALLGVGLLGLTALRRRR